MDSQIRLRPAALLAKGTDSTTQSNADVSCHTYSMAVFFGLHIAYRVQLFLWRQVGPRGANVKWVLSAAAIWYWWRLYSLSFNPNMFPLTAEEKRKALEEVP